MTSAACPGVTCDHAEPSQPDTSRSDPVAYVMAVAVKVARMPPFMSCSTLSTVRPSLAGRERLVESVSQLDEHRAEAGAAHFVADERHDGRDGLPDEQLPEAEGARGRERLHRLRRGAGRGGER